MSEQSKPTVSSVTRKILMKLSNQIDTSPGKAVLAKIRHSIGKPINKATEIWSLLFENLPEEFLGKSGRASYEETVILITVQLYALYQQGLSHSVLVEDVEKYHNIGSSLRQMRKGDDTTAIDRRFNVMITSSTFEELTHHLRHLVKLLKSRSPETKIDFAKLSQNLYWFLRDSQETVRLDWAREYYKQDNKGEKDNDNIQ
ncbi:type I-E CRISPR-associated protein Cse2/CasB [Streptococcus mutans]|uniref:type I-E CRISPR-associated protein Cse2/CasB n=1 Tax=Streptococcus mutans TaxID=1309 RepID=UPI001455D611|nr:type I-E CRISPR-associated protein Cse2/CasB [Streptococcus mutans]NLQ59040.1 type I-E CRISPR-associated protein Cse2/CasB [Streptococcus mutans]